MRWLKHYADARGNPKLRHVERKLGEAGYARFFKLLEIVAQLGGSGEDFRPEIDLKAVHTGPEWLAEELGIPAKGLKLTLGCFAAVGLIDPEAWKRRVISIPQMIEYRDEYSRKHQKKSGACPDTIPTNSGACPASEVEVRDRRKEVVEPDKIKALRAAPFKKSAAAQAREDERRRQQISPEGAALLKKFSGES